jgi:hypothetical protein
LIDIKNKNNKNYIATRLLIGTKDIYDYKYNKIYLIAVLDS